MGEASLDHSAPDRCRVRVIFQPLPRRPPAVRDELLSSWIRRLARANHCSVEELCGYLGLRQGRVPEHAVDLGNVNLARFCAAVQRTPDEIVAMSLPDTTHLAVQCVSHDDLQICESCTDKTSGLTLRHWRFAWSLTCETCGRTLVAKHPADGISDRLRSRAARGAEALRAAVAINDTRLLRRVDLAVHLLSTLGLASCTPLTSGCQAQRLTALAAVGVGAARPLLGTAILLRGNDRVVWELRRAFPQQRRAIGRIQGLSQTLERRLPEERCETERAPELGRPSTDYPTASDSALKAARQAILELGSVADREALLARADAIWKL